MSLKTILGQENLLSTSVAKESAIYDRKGNIKLKLQKA